MGDNSQRPKPTVRKRLGRLLLIGFVTYGCAIACIATFQRRFIYFPTVISAEAADASAKSSDLERWRNRAGQAIGWKRMSPLHAAQGRVLITHGNAGCAIDRSNYAFAIQQSAALDVFILEYPGYGDRPGSPSQRSLFQAADEAFELLATNGPVYLLGESLGTGVAAHLAGTYPTNVAGVLLIAPYNRLADVAQYHMPIVPVRWLLRDRFPSEEYLRRYHGPVVMLVTTQDEVVSYKFGRRLYDGYAGPKLLRESNDAGHNTIQDQGPEFWKQVVGFWQEKRSPTK